MRYYGKVKNSLQIWIRPAKKIIIDALEHQCCSLSCPYFLNKNTPECVLFSESMSDPRTRLRPGFKRWHRTSACIRAERARNYLTKKELQE